MKKIFTLALVLALALNMVACGGGAPKADAPAKSPEAPAATAEPAPTKAPDPTEGYPRGYSPKYT
ncbi:MAG: hypothetical protein RSA20_08535, partial [Oscillospiraceae bacterium]